MIFAFIILPAILFFGLLLAPGGWIGRAAVGLGAVILGYMIFDAVTWTNTSGDPHAGIGRGLGLIALSFNAIAYGTGLMARRARFWRQTPGAPGRWLGLGVGAGCVLLAVGLLTGVVRL